MLLWRIQQAGTNVVKKTGMERKRIQTIPEANHINRSKLQAKGWGWRKYKRAKANTYMISRVLLEAYMWESWDIKLNSD